MIANELLHKGILQIGRFQAAAMSRPYRILFEMLPAYPPLLEQIAHVTARSIPDDAERIVADADVMSVGVMTSLLKQISLVYSRGRGEAPVYDLVGAYDVGHPAVLLVGEYTPATEPLIANCARVGLEVRSVIALVGSSTLNTTVPCAVVVDLHEMITQLEADGLVPAHQAQAIRASL